MKAREVSYFAKSYILQGLLQSWGQTLEILTRV